MEFRLLGPVEVIDAGRPVALGGRRQRAVLTHLALSPGTPLTPGQLVDRVWGDQAPGHVRASLHTYVSRLRAALGAARLETRSTGYVLHAAADEVDALRFEHLVATAAAVVAHDPRAAADACTQALALWRGRALGDLADEGPLRQVARRLEALRETAREQGLTARLACGDAEAVLPELAVLVDRSPLREDLWCRYVLALYRSGRTAEAVVAGDRARRLLDEQLGVVPGPALRRLYEQVLQQDPGLAVPPAELHRYRLLEVLGRGPSAVVHRALQPWVGRSVALKVLHPDVARSPALVRGFGAAVEAAGAVEHPGVLRLHDCWRSAGEAALVLELAPGRDLAGRPPAGLTDLLRLVARLAEALDACGRHGVVRGRLAPADVLLSADGEPLLSPVVLPRDPPEPEDRPGPQHARALAGLAFELGPTTPELAALLSAAVRGEGAQDPRALAEQVQRLGRPQLPAPRSPQPAVPLRPVRPGPAARRAGPDPGRATWHRTPD